MYIMYKHDLDTFLYKLCYTCYVILYILCETFYVDQRCIERLTLSVFNLKLWYLLSCKYHQTTRQGTEQLDKTFYFEGRNLIVL